MKESSDNNWISFSDIMTVLMIIFLFISISYMMQVRKEQATIDEIFKEFKATKEELYNELNTVFKNDFQKWEVQLDKDLSIKFTNPDVLFLSGRTNIRPYFLGILDEFLPKYFDVILQEKYKDKISEIRIEGHTDMTPVSKSEIPYIGNLILSQQRSTAVMEHFIRSKYYKSLQEHKRWWLLFNFTANGLSYGRTLDDNREYTYNTKNDVNKEFSRRVEFRIITTSDKLIDKVLKEFEK
ncbi:OmpA family protein [Flavobacteriaceae bacterium]|nr:OmpA family protein [Flavobacteriaceae bacterium]